MTSVIESAPYRGKNNKAKMTLYNALPQKFSISSEETIDSSFTQFNVIVTSLKSLDQDYSSNNHARKFLCALLLKWIAKVTIIEESKDLATVPLYELIGNHKVYEMILENDGVASKTTKEKVKSLAIKAKVTREQTSDDSDSQRGSDEDVDEEEVEAINLMAKNFRKLFQKGDKKHDKFDICKEKTKGSESLRHERDGNKPQNDATCLMAIESQEVLSKPSYSNNDLDIIDLQKENEELLRVMVAFVISISSNTSEESVGSSTSRVILFGMIPTVIPADVSTIVPVVPEVTAVVA
ncbi:hypothetical protein Tco_0846564 [Tanacetum coccineum]